MDFKAIMSATSVRKLSRNGITTPADLTRVTVDGSIDSMIDAADVERIRAAFALGRELLTHVPPPVVFRKPKDLADFLTPRMRDLEQEHVYIVMLLGNREFIDLHLVGVGTADQCLAHPRDVFRPALRAGADIIVLTHNHPRCTSIPSQPDIELTGRMAMAGEIVGIPVLDHIIIGRDGWSAVSDFVNPNK